MLLSWDSPESRQSGASGYGAMPSVLIVGAAWALGGVVFFGVTDSLAWVASDDFPEGSEGTTDGVAVGAGLHAASRRTMVMNIPRFLGYMFYSLLGLLCADRNCIISAKAAL